MTLSLIRVFVFLGPNELSIRDVSAIQPLMGSQGWPKGPREYSKCSRYGLAE